jgi:hypothetical protein
MDPGQKLMHRALPSANGILLQSFVVIFAKFEECCQFDLANPHLLITGWQRRERFFTGELRDVCHWRASSLALLFVTTRHFKTLAAHGKSFAALIGLGTISVMTNQRGLPPYLAVHRRRRSNKAF